MAISNTAIKVSDLDFTSIKDSLKTYLKSQTEFTDYDFEGSGMNVLLDLLAYNTYYNGFYLNMVANESFLDTAQVRKNILSHSKLINYIPTSSQGSLSKIDVTATPVFVENQDVQAIILDKYTGLLGRDKNGVNYPFVTINANTAFKSNGAFYFPNVYIKQGEVITQQYEMTSNNVSRSFELPSANVDTTTLLVTVQASASNTYVEEYFIADDLTEVRSNTRVYYLSENENLNYTIQFGDNVLGKRPANGNIVTVTYIDTVGAIANNIGRFTFTEPVGGYFSSNVIVSNVRSSYGGTDKESIDDIRFRAPYAYTAQNRAVTKTDYEVLVSKDYQNIEAVSVWGGEENDPISYGKVFMSLKTRGYYALTNIEKEEIKNNLIKSRNVMTVIPEIVDPDYCFILVRGQVTYNPKLTNKTPAQLQNAIRSAIIKYNEDELNTFRSTLRKSKLQTYIDNADPSITGSDVGIFLQKQIDIYPTETRNYDVRYNAPLTKGSYSEKFYSWPEMTTFDLEGNLRKVSVEEVPQSFNGISSINITDTGAYYSDIPTITITGDGSGANAVALVVNGRVVGANIIDKGHDYTQASVAITGGGGRGASAVATVDVDYADLRTYYYKPSGEKVIVNPSIGTIDYAKGRVALNSFNAINVIPNSIYANNVVTFNAIPESDIITPLRNRILSIDSNDPKSIIIDLIKET